VNEPGRRAKRVGQIVRDHVGRFLVTQVADPRLSRVVITDVQMSGDLSIAHLSIRLLGGTSKGDEPRLTLTQLQLISGRLRRSLGPKLQLRRVPELRFSFDSGYEAEERVEQILTEIYGERDKADEKT
jgi:ribosome-binding factor A